MVKLPEFDGVMFTQCWPLVDPYYNVGTNAHRFWVTQTEIIFILEIGTYSHLNGFVLCLSVSFLFLCLSPLVSPVFAWIRIRLMKSSLKRLVSKGLTALWTGALWLVDIAEDPAYEIKEKEGCHVKLSLCSSQQTHLSLFLHLFVFPCLTPPGFRRQTYSHPSSCATAVCLSFSANGYLLSLLPTWLWGGCSTEQGALTLSHLGVRTQFPWGKQRRNKTDSIQGF